MSVRNSYDPHSICMAQTPQGMWYLLTDIKAECAKASRKWDDKHSALKELGEEGWKVSAACIPTGCPGSSIWETSSMATV